MIMEPRTKELADFISTVESSSIERTKDGKGFEWARFPEFNLPIMSQSNKEITHSCYHRTALKGILNLNMKLSTEFPDLDCLMKAYCKEALNYFELSDPTPK